MKIKKIEVSNKNKLIELQIIKSKLYKKNILDKEKTKISKTKLYLKKVTNIIYDYHIHNKKILFINFPINIQKKIYKTIKKSHQHIFTNEKFFISDNSKKYVDLIIQFNPNIQNYNQSLQFYNIPRITINENSINPTLKLNYSYKITGHLKFIEKQINNNFFFSILHSIFKQTTLKRKQSYYRKNIKSIIEKKRFQ